MTAKPASTHRTSLRRLRAILQGISPKAFETMVSRLGEELLGVRFAQARSGSQEGADMGTVGREGRRLRIEAKRYSGNFDARDILGGFHQAINRDPALEAWIASATRDIPEQLANALEHEGDKEGVPVLSIDFPDTEDPALAALCTAAPEVVAELAGQEGGDLAVALGPSLASALDRLRRELEQWKIGFELIRGRAADDVGEIWHSKRKALAAFGQDVAGGDGRPFVRREGPQQALSQWWEEPAVQDGPAIILGQGGYGKTWATVSWIADSLDRLPIVLTLPARSILDGTRFDENRIVSLLGSRLAALTGVRDGLHWSRRIQRFLRRPAEEGPGILLLIDGLNENPQVDWISLFQLLQDRPFTGRIRAIATCRPQFYEARLGKLRSLVQQGRSIPVERFDVVPGGELDRMLAAHGLSQSDLHDDLVDLARVPRLFPLVIRLHDRLADAGRVTIHRLLWEYGRDVFGERAGRSFSETEWREWLAEIARRERAGQRPQSLAELSVTASRPDLAPSEVSARLSDIIEGNLTAPGSAEGLLSPDIVAHALGAALLNHVERLATDNVADLQAQLDEWLDPISDLEERAELLRAACSILAERDEHPPMGVAVLIVAAWLQSQNLPESHQSEARRLGPDLVAGLLGAIETSGAPSHALARSIAIDAVRLIPAGNTDAYGLIVEAGTRWVSHVSLDISSRVEGREQIEAERSQRFIERVGQSEPGNMTVLGVPLEFEAQSDEALQHATATLLDGRPLAGAVGIFLRAAIAAAIRHRFNVWEDLKWLCLLNEIDPDETAAALRALSADVAQRTPEEGVNSGLAGRVAGLLLWLTGMETDEDEARSVDSGIDHFWNYEDDYLNDPGQSLFRLERRHAAAVLADRNISLRNRIHRAQDFILDPTFELPRPFIEDVRAAAENFDMSKLDVGRSRTIEDVAFEDLEGAAARCAPDLLADMHLRKLTGYADRSVETFDPSAWAVPESILLVNRHMAAGCQSLRERSQDAPSYNSSSPASLLLGEVIPLPPADQIPHILDSDLDWIPVDFEYVLRPVAVDTVDQLLETNQDRPRRLKNLVCLLSSAGVINLSEQAWNTIEALALDQAFEARGCAFIILEEIDPLRLGRKLLEAGWDWLSEDHELCRHYGSRALIAAGEQLTFEELAPRIHPTLIAHAVTQRGSSRPDAELAAEILESIVIRTNLDTPDPGATITVDTDRRGDHPLLFSVTPGPMPGEEENPLAALTRDLDEYQEHTRRAVETARERIRAAQAGGARLYLSNIRATDLLPIISNSPERVCRWLEGMEEVTADFRRRVALAEGFYLALVEAALILNAPEARTLWRALNRGMHTRYVGLAGVVELVLMLFRTPENAAVLELRNELLDLTNANTDESLLDIAVAAIAHERHDWLEQVIERGRSSPYAWVRRRSLTMSGFATGASLPVAGTHPEGPDTTSQEERIAASARRLARDAIARHWWRAFVSSESRSEAFAAWTLFRRSADRRTFAWLRYEPGPDPVRDDLSYRKAIQVELNGRDLRKQAHEREKNGSANFLDRRTTDNIAPWYAH